MKTICAWCQKHMSGDPKDTMISHGICSSCHKEMLKDPLLHLEKEPVLARTTEIASTEEWQAIPTIWGEV